MIVIIIIIIIIINIAEYLNTNYKEDQFVNKDYRRIKSTSCKE